MALIKLELNPVALQWRRGRIKGCTFNVAVSRREQPPNPQTILPVLCDLAEFLPPPDIFLRYSVSSASVTAGSSRFAFPRLEQIRHRFRHCGGIYLQTELERLFWGKAGTNSAQLFSLNSLVELHGTAPELLAAECVEPKRAHPFREHSIGVFPH